MRRIVMIACVVLLLTGCKKSTVGKEVKICTSNIDNDKITYRIEAEDDLIKKVDTIVEVDEGIMDSKALAELGDAEKEYFKVLLLIGLGIESNYNDVTASFDISEEKVMVTLSYDLTKMPDLELEKIGMSSSGKLSTTIKDFISIGFECD